MYFCFYFFMVNWCIIWSWLHFFKILGNHENVHHKLYVTVIIWFLTTSFLSSAIDAAKFLFICHPPSSNPPFLLLAVSSSPYVILLSSSIHLQKFLIINTKKDGLSKMRPTYIRIMIIWLDIKKLLKTLLNHLRRSS